MLKRLRRGFEGWGHYLLALLCAGVILLSAAWTREQRAGEISGQQALSDQSQRLSQVVPPPEQKDCGRPAEGKLLRGYSDTPVFFPASRMWRIHPATDFEAAAGDRVYAVLAGTVVSCENGCVRLDHGDGLGSLYRGLKQMDVSVGQTVRKGAVLGKAGGRVPYEGAGHICVTLLENGVPRPVDWHESPIK